jgi:magnesium-transporting ATPase (P-type)
MLLFVVPFVLMQGSLHASLVEVVRAHKMLRTSPYCKRIFSKTQFKKWCSNKTTTTTTTICCCVCVLRIYAQSSLLINLGKVFMLIYNMWLEWIVFIKFVLVCVVFYMIFYLDAWFIFMSWDLSDIILYLNFFFK